jgi:hypothetical protein
MSALADNPVVVKSFDDDQYVSIDLEHPMASRYTSSILRVPVGRVVKSREFTYGLFHSTQIHQCFVAWEIDGVESQPTWIDSNHLMPLEEVVSQLRNVVEEMAQVLPVSD